MGGQGNTTWQAADGFNQNENFIAFILQPKTKRNTSFNFSVIRLSYDCHTKVKLLPNKTYIGKKQNTFTFKTQIFS